VYPLRVLVFSMDNMDMLLFWGVICETPEANMNKRFIYCSWETQNLFLNFGIFFGPFFVGHIHVIGDPEIRQEKRSASCLPLTIQNWIISPNRDEN